MKTSRFALAIALLALVAWLAWMCVGWEAARGVVVASASGARRETAVDTSQREPERSFTAGGSLDVGSVRAPVAAGSVSSASSSSGRASPDWNVGHLVVRAVDAATNEPLRSIRVRCMSEARLADELSQDPSGEIDLALSSGAYSILVSSSGYEPIELPEARVRAGETLRLAPARLSAGNGGIQVDVAGVAPGGGRLFVELIGTGRHPCGRCGEGEDRAGVDVGRAWQRSDACPTCGFARDRSRLPLAFDAYAEFVGLASGSYALRIIDDRGFSVCEPRDVLLSAGDDARVAFDLASQRHVRVECVDVDGRSLSEEWRRRLAEPGEEESAGHFSIVPISLSFSDAASACVATATLVPPAPHGGASFFTSRRAGATRPVRRPSFVDRPRQPGEELRPQPTPPQFGTPQLACDVEDDGLARVGPLPSSAVAVHATAASFAADASVPEASGVVLVTLRLRLGEGASSPPESATYCAYELAQAK